MATFGEIKTRVTRRVIDLPAAVLTEVPLLVNEAQRELQRRHNFKVMEKTASFTTVEGARSLGAMPSDFKEFRGEPWRVGNTGTVHGLVHAADRSGLLLLVGEQDVGFPRLILDGDPASDGSRSFEVYPLPDGNSDYVDGEYRIKVPYWGFIADLSADGETNWFTNNASEWLFMKATAEAFSVDWDEERMALWLQKAEAKFAEIVRADKRYRLSGVTELVPHIQGAWSPRVRI